MRYRIQIQPMLDDTLVVVTSYTDLGSVQRQQSKMYTLRGTFEHGGLVELLGELQREIGETTD